LNETSKVLTVSQYAR